MCGRFTHLYKWRDLHRLMTLTTPLPADELAPRYNIAPTQSVPVVRQHADGTRDAAFLRWGLVPFWAKDITIGNRLINARSEEAAGKPSFRAAIKKRRCLVPASAFYEWQAIEGQKVKQPWAIRVKDVPLFAFAGLWERWDDKDGALGEPGAAIETFTILTTAPNDLLKTIHNRMPVIVKPEDYDRWLDPKATDPAAFADVLAPFSAERMEMWKISTRVNAPKNDDPSLLDAA